MLNMEATSSHNDEKPFYITTAINYTNGAPHIGHAYEIICTDVIARFQRLLGKDVYFLTGSDEHGQKIADTATKMGITPLQLCDKNVQLFKELNDKLLISNTEFIRTTSREHQEIAREVWQKAFDAGDIYLGTYSGWYNVREERFIPETEAKMDNYIDKVSGKPLQRTEEPSYFFKLSKYRSAIIDWINGEEPIQPAGRKNEILKRLDEDGGLADLSISRTSFGWGIPVPNDPEHIMYVWFDALTNYLSGINHHPFGDTNSNNWPADVHIIGQDIIWFHAVIWPAMLMSIGEKLPKKIFAHGFIVAEDGIKMSKSLDNTVDPVMIIDKYGAEAFRWYLVRETKFGDTLAFSQKGVANRFNGELADEFLNLVNRVISLAKKYTGGRIADLAKEDVESARALYPLSYPFSVDDLTRLVKDYIDKLDLHGATIAITDATRQTNRWLNNLTPWAKVFNPMKKELSEAELKLTEVLRKQTCMVLIEAIFILNHFYSPFVPNIAKNIFGLFEAHASSNLFNLSWASMPVGSEVISPTTPLFKKFLSD